jgi:hypothetical protein
MRMAGNQSPGTSHSDSWPQTLTGTGSPSREGNREPVIWGVHLSLREPVGNQSGNQSASGGESGGAMRMPVPPHSPGTVPALPSPGLQYWRAVLSSYWRDGYDHGVIDSECVELFKAGASITLRRPSAGWARADLVVRGLEGDDIDPDDPEMRGIIYSMRSPSTGDRLELSV